MAGEEAPKLEQQQAAAPPQEAGVEAGAEARGTEPKETLLQLGETYEDAAGRQPEETRTEGKEYVVARVSGANSRIDAISRSPGLNLPVDKLTINGIIQASPGVTSGGEASAGV